MTVLLSLASHSGGNRPALTLPLYLSVQSLLVFLSKPYIIFHIFLAIAMQDS